MACCLIPANLVIMNQFSAIVKKPKIKHNSLRAPCAVQSWENIKMSLRALRSLQILSWLIICAGPAWSAEAYRPIDHTMADKTITLTGHDLSIDQLVQIARHGAKVAISAELRQGAADSFGLILEAQAEGVPVYLFNRMPGSGREIVSLKGDPDSEEYKAEIARRYDDSSPGMAESLGFGTDIPDEEIGRAMLAVDLNNMRYLAASPGFVLGLADLLNHGVTPAGRHRRGRLRAHRRGAPRPRLCLLSRDPHARRGGARQGRPQAHQVRWRRRQPHHHQRVERRLCGIAGL